MTNKLEKTEQLVRRQERALNSSSSTSRRPQSIEVWRGIDIGDPKERRVFVAKDYFEEGGSGKLKKMME